ncbi:MAG: lipoate--protein ligase [Muribaculaceae bacterium]|nr:lipoate--protein ligase [Muribaculaceae bacterium]
MKHIRLPQPLIPRKLPFYLAMEEYAARMLPADSSYFFMWRVEPTVIFGRNQVIDREVNLEYCSAHGIEVYRRRSGGGCVYADMSNIMFSYIESGTDPVAQTFSKYTHAVAAMLQSLGLEAEATGRNDILICGRKVSGNAFYHLPGGHSIVHGTMLYDTDLAHMASAITPSRSKLDSKGVASVSSRITTLSRHISMTIEQFMDYALRHMCTSEITLTQADVSAIEELSLPYYSPQWIYRRSGHGTLSRHAVIPGAGEFNAAIELADGHIEHIDLTGDFFICADIDTTLLSHLRGAPYTRQGISHALRHTRPELTIPGLTAASLTDLIIS